MELRFDDSISLRRSGWVFGAAAGLFFACSSSDAPLGNPSSADGGGVASGAAGESGSHRAGAGNGAGSSASGGRVGTAGNAGHAGNPDHAGSSGSSDRAGAGGSLDPAGGAAGEGDAPDEAAGSSGAGGAEGEGRAEVALVASYLGGMIVYAIDPQSGALSQIPGSPFDKGAELFGVALSSSSQFAYATDFSQGLRAYRVVLDTGKLAPLTATPIATPATAGGALAIDPQDRFLYVFAGQELYTYRLAADGVPSLSAATPPTVAGGIAFIAADPSGRFVYVAQTFGGLLGYRVAADTGALSPIVGATFGTPQTEGGALVVSLDGKYLYSTAGGLNAFSIEPTTGALTLLSQTPYTLDVGSDPYSRVLALDPAGEFAFTVHSLTDHLSGFKVATSSGLLSALDGLPVSSMQSAYSVGVERSGRFVYVGGDAGGIVGYALDRAHGTLKRMAGPPFPIDGLQPEMAFVELDTR